MTITILGYSFFNTNSKTSAGGVGLYLAEQLNFIRRHDLGLPAEGVESCWIEITVKRNKMLLLDAYIDTRIANLKVFTRL